MQFFFCNLHFDLNWIVQWILKLLQTSSYTFSQQSILHNARQQMTSAEKKENLIFILILGGKTLSIIRTYLAGI